MIASNSGGAPYRGDPMASAALGFSNFVNGALIRHPFVVLRRQCQVHDHATRKHLTPISLLPVVVNLAGKDGTFSLWKGAIGSGVLWVVSHASEFLIAQLFNLPKSFVPEGSSERFWRHVFLKTASFFACTPFIVSSFIETVRSGASLSDDFQLFEIIHRGLERLHLDIFGTGVEGRRRHPLFLLAMPTAIYHTAHFLLYRSVYSFAYSCTRAYVSRKLPSERKRYHSIMPELFSTMTSMFVADLVCYPLETVLHRLYIQGTRTLVDNLDHGQSSLVPVLAGAYSGVVDCFIKIVRKEGALALYSGIGALFLQYLLQHGVALAVYWVLDKAGGSSGGDVPPIPALRSQENFLRADIASFDAFPQKTLAGSASSSGTNQQDIKNFSPNVDFQPTQSGAFPSFAQTSQSLQEKDNPFLAAIRRHQQHQHNQDDEQKQRGTK
ncbi:hypothetical protein niasHS_010128 [Heterodera schachtii]|uniref:Solute carrier family 25 member 46 n=1 Tax=Heterodera schachtii TaxID=97005 RepID=A0ABD2IYT8_HETSC